MILNKFKASLFHFIASLIVLGIILANIIIFWFPRPFLEISNFKEITIILLLVDLILGPLLTFVIYKPKKKSLKFDFSVIASIQILALAYGLYTLYLAHPVYITYHGGEFHIVTAQHADPSNAKNPNMRVSKLSPPKLAYLNIPDKETRNDLFAKMLNGQGDIETNSKYYEPVVNHLDKVILNGLDPQIAFKQDSDQKKVDNFLAKNGKKLNDYVFVPLRGSSKKTIWVLEKETGRPVDTINLNPIITSSR